MACKRAPYAPGHAGSCTPCPRHPFRKARGGAPGRAIDAVIPVRVQLLDPEQREAELSGYYAAQDGTLSLTFDLADNDLTGRWTVRVTELASGLTRQHEVEVDA